MEQSPHSCQPQGTAVRIAKKIVASVGAPVLPEGTEGAAAKEPGVERAAPGSGFVEKKALKWSPRASATAIRVLQRASKSEDVFRGLMLGALSKGDAFEPRIDRALEVIAGAKVTKSALTELYASCLEGTRVRLSVSENKGVFEYTVAWVNNLQDTVATMRRKLVRHENGALELYGHGAWVDPEQRSRGLSAHVMKQEARLLSSLSSHPETRLSLWTGGVTNPKKRSEFQAVGVYLWAALGFQLACANGIRSALGANKDRARCPGDEGAVRELDDLALLRRQFGAFLDRLATDGPLAGQTALIDKLKKASETWRDPFELAHLVVDGLRIETKVGDAVAANELGKAFLLSPEAPRWEGVFFVNRADTSSSRIAASRIERALSDANERRSARETELKRELRSKDASVRAQTVEQIGIEGGEEWVPRLRAAAKRDPELVEAVELAIERVSGRWRPPRPKIEYSTSYNYTPSRIEMPPEMKELEGLDAAALTERCRSAAPRVAGAALRMLFDKDPSLAGEEAKRLYERLGGEDDWLFRRWAIEILAHLPHESGLAALVELAPKEDDINVMVAIHRALEHAELPLAGAAAEVLSVRIEVMKEEIRIALEDLMKG